MAQGSTVLKAQIPDEFQIRSVIHNRRVRSLHAEGLSHGGVNEGAPGFREAYSPNFYVGYLRDPDGNKMALFCTSESEPISPE